MKVLIVFLHIFFMLSCGNQKSEKKEILPVKENHTVSNKLSSNCVLNGRWVLTETISVTNDKVNKKAKTILIISENQIKKIEKDSLIYSYKLEKIRDSYYTFNSGIHEINLEKGCKELSIMYFEKEGASEIYKKAD